MLEKIGTPGYETISTANATSTSVLVALLEAGDPAPVVAEIGVGIGATTLAMATCLANRGELHLYDFAEPVADLVSDLSVLGFTNVRGFPNTSRHWDSYNWTLAQKLRNGEQEVYDYIYIDGAHTFAVDALAFVLCDRLLKPGGYLEFDDYNWCFAGSRWMRETRRQFMTDEQIQTPQVGMVIDLFLRDNAGYEPVQPNRLYRKSLPDQASLPAEPSEPACIPVETVSWREQTFRTVRHPAVAAAVAEFRSSFEAGTLQFFDAVLPDCDRMIDVGAYVGLMSLYTARRVAEVIAFEPSPTTFRLLAQNVAANADLKDRIRLFNQGLSDRDQQVVLYKKARVDSGASTFRTVERADIVSGTPEGTVQLRDANAALRAIGVTGRTLLKIDIEGAEYLVVPALAGLLAEAKPFLHLSFHPFNLVSGQGEYVDSLVRIRRAVVVAEALAAYRFMYYCAEGGWHCVAAADRAEFLQAYLLRAKPVPRIRGAQYGFIDAFGFADVELAALSASRPGANDG